MFRARCAIVCFAFAQASFQGMWDHHAKAFADQDLDEIVKDYASNTVIDVANWVDGSLRTFEGPKAARDCFKHLFAQMPDTSDMNAPVVQLDDERGTVFLVWNNRASGIQYGADSFMLNKHGQFVRQHIVVSKPGSLPPARIEPDPQNNLPLHAAWKRHTAAFSSQNVDDLVPDYAEDVKLNVYNQADDTLKTYFGHAGLREGFVELFANLHDTSDMTAPVQLVEEASDEDPGRVLLFWSCPASGYLNGADTFIANKDGKFIQQNIVVNYQPKLLQAAVHV